MPFDQMGAFTFNHVDQVDTPLDDATTIKTNWDSRGNELKTALNALVTALNSVTDGSSGADKLGMTPITETGAAATAQAIIEALITRLKATTDSASGADLIGATGIPGLTGATAQALLESLKTYVDTQNSTQDTALATHKTSSDHDSRYFTETELSSTTDSSSGADKIGATQIATGSGTTTQAILEWLYTQIVNVTLGQVPNDSLTNAKLSTDIKVGSLAALTTTEKGSVVGAVNELKSNADAHAANMATAHETLQTIASATGTVNLDMSVANSFDVTLTGSTTFAFLNPPATGNVFAFTLFINQGATAQTITWPASVKWGNDSIPDLSAINKTSILVFVTKNGGTRWNGALVNNKYTT